MGSSEALGSAWARFTRVVTRTALRLPVGRSGVTSGFGAAGSLVALMVWVYYSAQIFLLGAEFTWVHAERRRLAEESAVDG